MIDKATKSFKIEKYIENVIKNCIKVILNKRIINKKQSYENEYYKRKNIVKTLV